MARGFAEGSGGGLSIRSEPGRGTEVSLWLPVVGHAARARNPAAASSAEAGRGAAATAGPAARGGRVRVLLVDDEPVVREILAAQLRNEGFDVAEAEDGAGALAVLDRGEAVDLLVSDLAMPGLDGVELTREARRRRSGLPAILPTG